MKGSKPIIGSPCYITTLDNKGKIDGNVYGRYIGHDSDDENDMIICTPSGSIFHAMIFNIEFDLNEKEIGYLKEFEMYAKKAGDWYHKGKTYEEKLTLIDPKKIPGLGGLGLL